MIDTATARRDFAAAISAAGMEPPDQLHDDGELHRFAPNGKPRDLAGWYVLHTDGIPAGIFGNWRDGTYEKWRADIGRKLTPEEEKAHRARTTAMRKAREQAERQGHEQAAAKAEELWTTAKPVTAITDHGYLARKQAAVYQNVRIGADGWLLVPMRDTDGKLWNLEHIAPEKPATGPDKKGLWQGRRKGLHFTIGVPKYATTLLVAEGFATGNSLYQATAVPTVVAFNAGNLLPVATAIRARYPDHTLVLCADDDYRTAGNPGLTAARKAASAVGGVVAFPDFGTERPDGATDFNDLHLAHGLDAVKRQIESLIKVMGEPEPQVAVVAKAEQPDDGPDPEQEPDDPGSAPSDETQADGPAFPPAFGRRPCYAVLDDWLEYVKDGKKERARPGVYYCGKTDATDTKNAATFETWICSPLHLDAVTFDGQENNFGRLLRFKNSIGRWRSWSMPMELLRGSGDELRGELLAMGVTIDPRQRSYLTSYLQSAVPKRRMRCALQTGWAGTSFVLPDEVIGPESAGVIFQSGERAHDEYTKAGTLESWRNSLAAMAPGNPLLLTAISVAFAGPILGRCHIEGGGIHFVGDSSTGKTTLIEAACSVWGGPNFRRSWRATANGMEGAASIFNDCLLALDEISECDPREIGAIVYALGNGRGKQRASRSGAARSVVRWQCALLSSGERTLATAMEEGGRLAKAGQSVRLLDVPAARAYGAWDDLKGLATGAALSDHLKRAAATQHGHAGRAYLEKLTRDKRDLAGYLESFKTTEQFAVVDGEGQEKRAAARFALFAMAGELATEYGVTGWPEGAAFEAAALCFRLWRNSRGKGNDERRQIAERLLDFIERHGDSRFSSAEYANDQTIVRDRAGWWRESGVGKRYLFTAGAMKEAVRGFETRRALDVLQQIGAIPPPGANGERATPQRIDGRLVRLYELDPAILAEVRHGS
jgi:putative DNA primase/helicase